MLRIFILLFAVCATCAFAEELPEICKMFPKGAFFSCCEVPRLVAEVDWKRCANSNKDDDVMITEPPPPDSRFKSDRGRKFRHFMGKCYGDCVFDDAGLLKDGDLDYDALKELGLSKVEGNATWAPVMEEAISNCTDAMATLSEERTKVCKTKADIFMLCVRGSLFKNCPAEFWKNEDQCEDAKEFFTVCPDFLQKTAEQPADAA